MAAPPRHRSTVRHHRRRRVRRALPEPLDSGPPPPKTGVVEAGLPHYRNHSNWRSPLGTTGGGGSAALPEPLATPDLNPPEQIFRKTQPPMHVHPSPCGPSRERRLVMSPQHLSRCMKPHLPQHTPKDPTLTGTGPGSITSTAKMREMKPAHREMKPAEMKPAHPPPFSITPSHKLDPAIRQLEAPRPNSTQTRDVSRR